MNKLNNVIEITNKNKQSKVVTIQELFAEDKNRAEFVLRELLGTLGFSKPTESLIQCKTENGLLFVLSLCPSIECKIPNFFMYDEPGFFFMPTLYNLSTQVLSAQKKLLVPHSPDLHIKNIVEIPVKLEVFELKRGLMFGQYKMYHNMFVTDKIMGNKNVPDELENLLLKSMLKIDQSVVVDINRSTLNEYRKKIKKTWAKMEKYEISEKWNVFKEFNLPQPLSVFMPNNLKNKKEAA